MCLDLIYKYLSLFVFYAGAGVGAGREAGGRPDPDGIVDLAAGERDRMARVRSGGELPSNERDKMTQERQREREIEDGGREEQVRLNGGEWGE